MKTNSTKVLRRFIDGILNGDAGSDGIRPDSLQIVREGQGEFAVYIVNKQGERLVECARATLVVGDSLTISKIHRTFKIKIT